MTTDAKEINRLIGLRIKHVRLMRNMSQEKLGAALGITFQQLQKYEKGTNRVSAGRLAVIAHLLDTPITSFYADADGGALGMDGGSTLPDLSQAGIEIALAAQSLPIPARSHLRRFLASLTTGVTE